MSNQYQQPGMPQQMPQPGMAPQQQPGMPQQMAQPGMAQPQQMPQPGYQQQQMAPQHQPQQQNNLVQCGKINYTTISLFEVSGNYNPGDQYPKGICFVMGVPGVKNPAKASGRSYNQAAKVVMKFSTQELAAMGQSL